MAIKRTMNKQKLEKQEKNFFVHIHFIARYYKMYLCKCAGIYLNITVELQG
jgi:hypothetical protein